MPTTAPANSLHRRRALSTLLAVVALLATPIVAPLTAPAAAIPADLRPRVEASGWITVDGVRSELGEVEVQPAVGGFILSLVDRELPEGCVGAVSGLSLSEVGTTFAGMDLAVDREQRTASVTIVTHPAIDRMDGLRPDAEAHPVEITGGVASGTFEGSLSLGDHEATYGVSFSFPSDVSYAMRPEVSGEEGPLRDAVEALLDAWIAGDFETLQEVTAGRIVEMAVSPEVAADPARAAEEIIAFSYMMFPQRISLDETTIDGRTAVIRASGESRKCTLPVEHSTGRIELVRERRTWKVSDMEWE